MVDGSKYWVWCGLLAYIWQKFKQLPQGEANSETARLRPSELNEIINVIRTWQDARQAKAFPVDVLEMLQDEEGNFTWRRLVKIPGNYMKK